MKNKFNQLVTVLIAFYVSIGASIAQEYLPESQLEMNAHKYEEAFNEWALGRDLSHTKGWKWYYRWLHQEVQRADSDGSFADKRVLFSEAIKVSEWKKQTNSLRGGDATWMPLGPNAFPIGIDPSWVKGIGRINCITFHPTDPNTFWVGVAQGGVWKTDNSGQSWTPLTDDLPILRISDIAVNPNDPDEMYISVGDYAYLGVGLQTTNSKRNTHYGLGVYKSVDGGQSWFETGLNFRLDESDASLIRRVFVDPNDGQHLLAAGIQGIWSSLDGGENWNKVRNDLIWDIEADPSNPNILYATTGYVTPPGTGLASILKSTDFGATWVSLNTGIPTVGQVTRIEVSVSRSHPDVVYAIAVNIGGGFYGLFRSLDGGDNWTTQSTTPNIFNGGNGQNGTTGQASYDLSFLVHPTNPDIVVAGGVNLWISDTGGLAWNGVSHWVGFYGPSIHGDHHFMAYNPLDQKIYACHDGGISRTDEIKPGSWNDANTIPGYTWPTEWEHLSDGMQITSFYRIATSKNNPDYVMAGAQDNATMLKRGNEWVDILGGDGMECLIHPDDPNILYSSFQFGNVYKSIDGGDSLFGSITTPITSVEATAWTTPYLMHDSNPDHLFAGAGNVWKSTDGGSNWQQISLFPLIQGYSVPLPSSALAVAPSNENRIYVAKRLYSTLNENGQMWSTGDGGTIWNDISIGLPNNLFYTYLAVDDEAPETVWATMGGFEAGSKVYTSTDAGSTWENITYNLPNLPVNCVVQDPNSPFNTIYIGMDVGVYYINDQTSEWVLFSDQLPNVIVTELEINPTSKKLYASTFGRGLWYSDLADEVTSVQGGKKPGFQFTVVPISSSGSVDIDVSPISLMAVSLEIIDIMGRTVHQSEISNLDGGYTQTIPLNLLSGKYFVRLSKDRMSRSTGFVMVR